MYLRKTSNQKTEVSFDEPLNTDWDGNELLLSDILGPESDLVMRPPSRRMWTGSSSSTPWRSWSPGAGDHPLRFRAQRRSGADPKEVADRLGISQSYISRLEKRIISRPSGRVLRMIWDDNF